MSARKLSEPEMTSAHSVKILLCYLLDRLDRPVPSEQLHEIALDSGVINHFYYSEAMADLIASGAVTVTDENGEETAWRFHWYVECDEENGTFYAENGRLYTRADGKLVTDFIYWNEAI